MTALLKVADVAFPAFRGINVNMMPFVMGDPESIPADLRHYLGVIEACDLPDSELGKVGYLSVSESRVLPGLSQRRPGIHTEGHVHLAWGGGGWGGGSPILPDPPPKPKPTPKPTKYRPEGGLYQASTVDDSCRVWDRYVDTPGPMGDCEHLRSILGPGFTMKAGEVYWMTDRTPHEALALETAVRRQWFRLVTSAVDVWYRRHSTTNPLGVVPPCRVVDEDKFAHLSQAS